MCENYNKHAMIIIVVFTTSETGNVDQRYSIRGIQSSMQIPGEPSRTRILTILTAPDPYITKLPTPCGGFVPSLCC